MQRINNILLCLIITLIIEISISIMLGIKKKDIIKISVINIFTNVPLNIIVNILLLFIRYNIVYYIIVPILEVIVIVVEGKYFKRLSNSIINNYVLSIFLNLSSYSIFFIYIIINHFLTK